MGFQRFSKDDHIFDGFCHRNFDEETDGWLNEVPDPRTFPSLQMAGDISKMYQRIVELTRENWELRQKLKTYEPLVHNALEHEFSKIGDTLKALISTGERDD